MDACRGVRWLTDRRLAGVVKSAMLHGAGLKYELVAYVVMPNHVHWVFRPLQAGVYATENGKWRSAREAIMHSFRRHTALACNRLLGRSGKFWQHECHDHVVRNGDELIRIVRYIEANPVRAGLCRRAEEWEFSSAWKQRE